ncbi:MAG: hypothetical protein LBB67_08145 [Oscillospiraceae bacterium]|jgi:hypothetical protein|nr:hypothetical protein [Oscillospiraceae bacterium]
MRIFYLAVHLLWKRKLLNLILLIQILLSIITLTPIVARIIQYAGVLRTIDEFRTESVYHVKSFAGLEANMETQLQGFDTDNVGTIYFVSADVNCLAYNKALTEIYMPSLAQGEWFSDDSEEWKAKSEGIPVVVSADTKRQLGEVFSIALHETDGQNAKSISAIVIGILRNPSQYLDFHGWADPQYMRADMLIRSDTIVLLRSEDIASLAPDACYAQDAYLVSLKNTTIDENYLQNKLEIYGFLTPFSQLIEQFRTTENESMRYEMTTFVIYMLLAVVGIGGSNFVQNIENQRNFTIYYLVGLDWKKRILIELSRLFLLLIFSMFGTFLLGLSGFLSEQGIEATYLGVFMLAVTGYLIFVFFVTSVGFLRSSIKTNPMDAVREFCS